MPATLVQSKTAVTTVAVTSQSCVYDSAPTQGNLLICCAGCSGTITMSSSGWTLAAGGNGFVDSHQWYKIAGASESATVTITHPSESGEMCLLEYSGMSASPLDKVATGNPGGTPSTLSTGTTTATTQADEIAVAQWTRFLHAAPTALSNSFVSFAELNGQGGTTEQTTVALKTLTVTGTVESTATFTGTTSSPVGCVATYKIAVADPAIEFARSFAATTFGPF